MYPEQKMDLSRDILKHPDIARYYENWGRKGDIALVAATEGNQPTLFGCVWGRLFSPGKRGYGFINKKIPELSIAVDENHRNKGIGTRLVQAICTAYKEADYKHISLSVNPLNPSMSLYKREGFKIHKLDQGSSIIMIKNLEEKAGN